MLALMPSLLRVYARRSLGSATAPSQLTTMLGYAATVTTGVGLRRWADNDSEVSIGGHHRSYLDAVVSAPSARARARPASGSGQAGANPRRQQQGRWRSRCGRHVRSYCVAYPCGLWRVTPILASAVVDGSPPRMSAGGGRYSTNSRRGQLLAWLCLAPTSHSVSSPQRSSWSFLGDASTVCPLLIE